jgi:hypothetical protein
MAKRLILLCVLTLVSYSGTSALALQDFEEQIAGKWRVDVPKTRTYLKMPTLASDPEEDFLKQVSKLSVEFWGNHSVTVHESENDETMGQWELVKDEDGQVEIDLIRDGEEEATRARIEFLDRNSVAIAVKSERPLVFVRVDAPAKEGVVAQLIGTWQFDRQATLGLESNKQFDEARLNDMLQEVSGMVVSFSKDGSFTAASNSGERAEETKGTWESRNLNEDQRTFELSLKAEIGPDSLNVEFRDDGSVRFWPPNQPSAVFVRKVEKGK